MTAYTPGDYRLLAQTEIWVDKHGTVYRLEDMNPHHRASLIPFLRRRAKLLNHLAFMGYLGTLGSVEDPSDGVWSAQQDAEHELNLPPEEWLELQPLMRRLVELDQRTPIQKQITKLRNRTYPLRRRLGLAD